MAVSRILYLLVFSVPFHSKTAAPLIPNSARGTVFTLKKQGYATQQKNCAGFAFKGTIVWKMGGKNQKRNRAGMGLVG